MKFPFSLFGKKSQPARGEMEEVRLEPAPFPVDQAVAQVQAATGMQFGLPPTQQSELQAAAAVLSVLEHPAAATPPEFSDAKAETQTLQVSDPPPLPMSTPVAVAVPAPASAPAPQPVVPEARAAQAAAQATEHAPPAAAVQPSTNTEPQSVVGRDEVIAAYRLFLRRDPESDDVIAPRLGITREKLLSTFIVSPEFLQRAENVNLVLEVAKSVELRQVVAATPGLPVVTQADVEAAKRIFWPLPDAPSVQPQAGDSVDRAIAQLMRSDQFQSNTFNAQLVAALAKQILERLNQK
jgi:hypothetical protein